MKRRCKRCSSLHPQRGMCVECWISKMCQVEEADNVFLPMATHLAKNEGMTLIELIDSPKRDMLRRLFGYGARSSQPLFDKLDWQKIIANWPLSFPEKGGSGS